LHTHVPCGFWSTSKEGNVLRVNWTSPSRPSSYPTTSFIEVFRLAREILTMRCRVAHQPMHIDGVSRTCNIRLSIPMMSRSGGRILHYLLDSGYDFVPTMPFSGCSAIYWTTRNGHAWLSFLVCSFGENLDRRRRCLGEFYAN
jgi:hypothetical protein